MHPSFSGQDQGIQLRLDEIFHRLHIVVGDLFGSFYFLRIFQAEIGGHFGNSLPLLPERKKTYVGQEKIVSTSTRRVFYQGILRKILSQVMHLLVVASRRWVIWP